MTTMNRVLGRSALVAYGSETGNAQDIAEELGRIAERLRFWTRVSCLDAVELADLLSYSVVIIAVSTTGQGDLPTNARRFWKHLLRRRLPPTCLEKVQFTIFGLGDSSYPKFNFAARKLSKRLLQLGAFEIHPRGEADEQHPEGLDAFFIPWSAALRNNLLARFPLHEGVSPIPEDVLLQPKWTLSSVNDPLSAYENDLSDNGLNSNPRITGPSRGASTAPRVSFTGCTPNENSSHEVFSLDVTLEQNQRLTSNSHWQDVRHIVFSSSSLASYDPGDVLTIYPKNLPEDVEQIILAMHWRDVADEPIRCVSTQPLLGGNPSRNLSSPSFTSSEITSLRKLLTDHLDFMAIPRRSFFSIIAHFTQDQLQKERLLEFTKPEYIDELYDYTTRPRRSILEVLQEFESVQIPWQWAIGVLPELRGRQFSIASGGKFKRRKEGTASFELLVAIVKYQTVIKKIREGVCTRYLAALTPGAQLQVSLQRGGLGVLKDEAKYPVVLIGPGTGVAPIRSLIWERLQWGDQISSQAQDSNRCNSTEVKNGVGETVLFFGCRRQDADYFFHDEWKKLMGDMSLQVFTAFSRDQTRKVYVQDLIKEQSELLFRLLRHRGGIVYVCGSSGNMPQGVRASLVQVFKINGMDQEAAEEYIQRMERDGRYKQETW